MEQEHGKKSKSTQKAANQTPRKSPGADASISDEKRYPGESRSEENCFGALNEKIHTQLDHRSKKHPVEE